jgi:hypothetical protein
MHALRRTFLCFGLLSFLGGVSQIAGPWPRLEQHVRQTLAIGGTLPAIRVNLGQSYALLTHAGVMGTP